MSKATFAGSLLEAAQLLLTNGKRNAAFRRRAVSTAYYAVFHAIDKLCADFVSRSSTRSSDEYLRVYRALDHAPLKHAFSHAPLRNSAILGEIGAVVVLLQNERHRADYLPPIAGIFTYDRATELVVMAREAVLQIESLKPASEECRQLALSLLFKERRS